MSKISDGVLGMSVALQEDIIVESNIIVVLNFIVVSDSCR